ncbi:MAG: hypothetical protein KDC80_26795 [Saprospiraceae bacterium]|nr:hypothetical protein [Saprospiraceae bacterium]
MNKSISPWKNLLLYQVLAGVLMLLSSSGCEKVSPTESPQLVSLRDSCVKSLFVLADALIPLQDLEDHSPNYGALYCDACSDFHTRASEAVLPFAVAFHESGKEKYLISAISTGEWLINQQQPDGAWYETPSEWTGTTTDQLLMMAVAYPLLKDKLSGDQQKRWEQSIKRASDWLVEHMDHVFASINYCATSTATLMTAFQIIPDSAYVYKADELAMLCASKFDEDYFFTGEGNRIRGTKYGVDLGYSLDMSLWGLGLYAELRDNQLLKGMVKKALERYLYFIYPDGSTDGSWAVRASKWTTYGSVTADGCQILFSLYAKDHPEYRTAALKNLDYLMTVRNESGLITYGPHYAEMYASPPCNYPTFCRAKNLAMAVQYGDQSEGPLGILPTQKVNWSKHFKTMDLCLVRTANFMTTITGYRYKDIRRGADFKYMHRPSGGAITNLWVEDYGYLQASSQTEYHIWEMHYPEAEGSLPITPRIEFADTNAWYSNLYEFDAHMQCRQIDDYFEVSAIGELKDRNRWEGGVAYTLTHKIFDDRVEKNIKLRFHGQKPLVKIVEPIIRHEDTRFVKIDDRTINIVGGHRDFEFKVLDDDYFVEMGTDEEKYAQPFPALKAYPIIINVQPGENQFIEEVHYQIRII